jgi:CelD/BcsL family acetyltransferase involved in cellulose biosynthesis
VKRTDQLGSVVKQKQRVNDYKNGETPMLAVYDILRIESLKDRLPKLSKTDSDFVVAHLVTLQAAGIPADASLEQERLENLVIQFGWRLAYCRYVETDLQGHRTPVRYDEWSGRQK